MPETSIIIRTRNEARWIGEVLGRLDGQTYRNFETILVDSGSTDETLEIASRFPARIIHIAPETFTYPSAINAGIRAAYATRYYCILSGHSLPIDSNWLASGVAKFSVAENVLGVYGPTKALPNSTLSDQLIHTYWYLHELYTLKRKGLTYRIVDRPGGGVLGFTNALIRKDLWEQYPINEAFASGGEDGDWATHWMERGYVAVKDSGFTVHHSHNLGPRGWWRQWRHWKSTARPGPFVHLPYRNDPAHRPHGENENRIPESNKVPKNT